MFDRILVPYDFSKSSREALIKAIEWGGESHAHLKVLHAMGTDLKSLPSGMLHWPEELNASLQQEIDRDVRYKLGVTGEKDLANIKIEITEEKPIHAILKEVHDTPPDIVIMGTHGRSGLDHVLLGSVAENVIRHSHTPVMIVRGETPIKKILVPVDFSESTEETLLLASQLCKKIQAEIHIVHVVSIADLYTTLPNTAGLTATFDEKDLKKKSFDDLQALTQKHPNLKAHTHVLLGVIHNEINDFAKRHNIDLILMPTHGRTGLSHFLLGSTTEMIARYAPCSVMTFSTATHKPHKKNWLEKALTSKLF